MIYYSTKGADDGVSLMDAVRRGLARDGGLYMPRTIERLPDEFFRQMPSLSLQELSFRVAQAFFGEDIPAEDLRAIVYDTMSFDIPLVRVRDGVFALELFHGPTAAFKDVGARFMARLLGYFNRSESSEVNVLVATSGDTGSAVANGFLGVEGVRVFVLYPKDKVSPLQQLQFTTLGRNITALEIDGVFDDCQRLVKQAFMDPQVNAHMRLTSANSINVARFLPQAFYYFYAVAQAMRQGINPSDVVICVPSGNFGNITAGLFGRRMGLPSKYFIAANNRNDVFLEYLKTGVYSPRASVQTLANAMDVGDPSNFARVLELYGGSHEAIASDIRGIMVDDDTIRRTIRECYDECGYVLDPHGACGYRAVRDIISDGEVGIFLETAHPAKFKETVENVISSQVPIPDTLRAFLGREKQSVPLSADFSDFQAYLLSR